MIHDVPVFVQNICLLTLSISGLFSHLNVSSLPALVPSVFTFLLMLRPSIHLAVHIPAWLSHHTANNEFRSLNKVIEVTGIKMRRLGWELVWGKTDITASSSPLPIFT